MGDPRTRRWWIRPVLLLAAASAALGLATTIAVAWLSAAFDLPTPPELQLYQRTSAGSVVFHVSEFGGFHFTGRGAERLSWRLQYLEMLGAREELPSRLAVVALLELSESQQADVFPRWWGSPPRIVGRTFAGFPELPNWIQDARGWPAPAFWCEWECGTSAVCSGGLPLSSTITTTFPEC